MNERNLCKFWNGKEMIYPPFEICLSEDGHCEVAKYLKDDDDCMTKLGCTHENCNLKEFYQTLVKIDFTGLKDKNGKSIYEGDIVKGIVASVYAKKISYKASKNTFLFRWDLCSFIAETIEGEDKRYLDCVFIEDREIIGNIYQNPELCTQSK